MAIRVFLVDDQAMVRAGFRMVIDSQPDLEVVGEASDGGEALQTLAVTRADVVLMDVRMPRLNGVETTRQLIERWAGVTGAAGDGAGGVASDSTGSGGSADGPPKVVVLTTFDLDEYVFAALKAGAAGFLLKDAPPADLLSAIRSVHDGDSVVAPSATKRLLERFSSYLPDDTAGGGQATGDPRADLLTERERDVVLEVTRGLSNAEIAERLFLSETTVKTHMGRILAKLDLRDRVQLVVFAYESGLVRAGNA